MLDKHHHITYNYEKLSRCTDLTIKDHLEATDRVLQGHQFALGSGEDLGNLELSAQQVSDLVALMDAFTDRSLLARAVQQELALSIPRTW